MPTCGCFTGENLLAKVPAGAISASRAALDASHLRIWPFRKRNAQAAHFTRSHPSRYSLSRCRRPKDSIDEREEDAGVRGDHNLSVHTRSKHPLTGQTGRWHSKPVLAGGWRAGDRIGSLLWPCAQPQKEVIRAIADSFRGFPFRRVPERVFLPLCKPTANAGGSTALVVVTWCRRQGGRQGGRQTGRQGGREAGRQAGRQLLLGHNIETMHTTTVERRAANR